MKEPFVACLLGATIMAAPVRAWVTTELVSVTSDGTQGSDGSASPAMSLDGRFVAFESFSRLTSDDQNDVEDVFVRDRSAGTTERVSIPIGDTPAVDFSNAPAISADGRFVAFGSRASNLIVGDLNGHEDVFVRDRQSGTTELVSVATDGTPGDGDSSEAAISGDGQLVAFRSAATTFAPEPNGGRDLFVRDRANGVTTRVPGYEVALSGNGRFVAIASGATDLVSDDQNGATDVFLLDRTTGALERVSVSSDGGEGDSTWPSLSADGLVVAFASDATNLVPGDTNGTSDVFVRDRTAGTTVRVSLAEDGGESPASHFAPVVSADGRFVAFLRGTVHGVDVFVHDRASGTTARVSRARDGSLGNGSALSIALAGDGSLIAFDTAATNLLGTDANRALQDVVVAADIPPLSTTTTTTSTSTSTTVVTTTVTSTFPIPSTVTTTSTTHPVVTPVTTTTVPGCEPGPDGVGCRLEREVPPAECAADRLPRAFVRALADARGAIGRAFGTRPRRRHRLLAFARRRLGAAIAAIDRLRPGLSAACRIVARDRLLAARDELRMLLEQRRSAAVRPRALATATDDKLSPQLRAILDAAAPGDLIPAGFVMVRPRGEDGAVLPLDDVVTGTTQAERQPLVVQYLKLVAREAASPLEQDLTARGCTQAETFWIFTGVIANCTPEVIRSIAARPTILEVDYEGRVPY